MDESRRCTATAKGTGERCKRLAIPGGKVCVKHGGAAPAVRAAAERRKAEAAATALLQLIWDPEAPPVTDPISALQKLNGQTLHAINVLGARVSTESLDGPTAAAWLRVMREGRQMLEGLQRLGLEERQVRVTEEMGVALMSVVRAVLERLLLVVVDAVGAEEAGELLLEQVWATAAREIVPQEFRRLGAESAARGEVQ